MHRLTLTIMACAALLGVTSCATGGASGQRLLNTAVSTQPAVITTDAISTTVQVTSTATRGERTQVTPFPQVPALDNPALAGCDAAVLRALVQGNPTARQWIVVLAPTITSTSATLQIATLGTNDIWSCSLAATPARVGRSGIRPLADRRSGDDTTPSGIFPLGSVLTPQGPVSFFGNSADPGARGPYRRVQADDCYGANPNTAGYGHWRSDAAGCTGADELLHSIGAAYEHAILIGANTEPDVSGDAPGEIAYASAIFVHRFTYTSSGAPKPTSGCVSVGHSALLTAVRTIDPLLDPHFAIGTEQALLGG
jgi:L,D-peptidoglycan transpeptidase YkuD (ErfK/YbiS/YcfS/YnhG family)